MAFQTIIRHCRKATAEPVTVMIGGQSCYEEGVSALFSLFNKDRSLDIELLLSETMIDEICAKLQQRKSWFKYNKNEKQFSFLTYNQETNEVFIQPLGYKQSIYEIDLDRIGEPWIEHMRDKNWWTKDMELEFMAILKELKLTTPMPGQNIEEFFAPN
jgi:hypothetical protein